MSAFVYIPHWTFGYEWEEDDHESRE
jgi:hypothetical protein